MGNGFGIKIKIIQLFWNNLLASLHVHVYLGFMMTDYNIIIKQKPSIRLCSFWYLQDE